MATVATLLDGASTAALQTKSLGRQVYELLQRRIIAGQMPPGTRLAEEALAAQLGVSRSPVREAIADLERSGLAERGGKRDRRVTIPDERFIVETYAVWSLLEAGNAYEASINATADTHRACHRLLGELERALAAGDHARYHDVTRRLHETMRAPAKNRLLQRILEEHQKFVCWLQALYAKEVEDFSADAVQEHRIIYEFYLKKDLLGLTHAMGTHVAHHRDRILASWRSESVPAPSISVYEARKPRAVQKENS